MRGIAALVVVFWHYASAFYPAAAAGPAAPSHTRFDVLVYRSPLSIFIAGNFAVVVFFVLSGFVLTVKFYSRRQHSPFPNAVKRYIRLMPIVLVSILFSYMLLTLGLMHFQQAGLLSGSTWLSSTYFQLQPALLGAIAQGLIVVFVMPLSSGTAYNPLLWTIYYELVGSILVFGLAMLTRGQSKRWLLYAIAIVGFINTFFCGFIVGAMLADVYANRYSFYEKVQGLSWVYRWLLLILALCIGAYPVAGDQTTFGHYWNALTLFPTNLEISRSILELIAAAILIILALGWTRLAALLERRPLVWLGWLSYSLYAVHLILIFSFSSWLMVTLHHHMSYNAAAGLALLISLPVMLGLSFLLHKYVERPSITAANKAGEWAKT